MTPTPPTPEPSGEALEPAVPHAIRLLNDMAGIPSYGESTCRLLKAIADGLTKDADSHFAALRADLAASRQECERLRNSLHQADKTLDDIDTAGDMFKPEQVPYFKYVARKCQEHRVERRSILNTPEIHNNVSLRNLS